MHHTDDYQMMEIPKVGRKWSMVVAAAGMGVSLILVCLNSDFLVWADSVLVPSCKQPRRQHWI
jgi:hypothetical protein